MKKLFILTIILIPFLGLGQNKYKLGSYINLKKNNIDFQFKKPLSPFQKLEESYALQGNINLVASYSSSLSTETIVLQIYATPIPLQFSNLDWDELFNSEKSSRDFLNSFLGSAANSGMKISSHKVTNLNGKLALEVKSTITFSGVTQKQINWITIYKNHFINILGSTLIDSFDKNLSFIKDFSNSIYLN